MDHATLSILMLFVALGLIIAEFFIPSGGLIAILAAICMSVSVWAAYQAWWETSPNLFWSYIATVIVATPLSVVGAFVLLQKTSLGKHVLLDAPNLEEVTPYSAEAEHLATMVGRRGKTISLLNPGGMVSVDGERFHCECPGLLIEPGEEVEVTGVRGNRLVVRIPTGPATDAGDKSVAANESLEELASRSEDDYADDVDTSPLDFDIPQS